MRAAPAMATSASASADAKPKPPPGPPPGPSVQYAYMFEQDKSPTKQLDALLRAIARHIIHEIGDKNELQLTPNKLAAFYKNVGGNYDPLFVEMPHASISYVWQATGCQHTLQPTKDDFDPPTIPALTLRGFSRWESLEILLGPDEHVPFMQHAVMKWALKHPDTGEPFPADLPADVFPAQPDADVDRWHKSRGDKLRYEAAARESERANRTDSGSGGSDQPEPRFAHARAHGPPRGRDPFANPWARRRHDDAAHIPRGFSYTHIPARHSGSHGSRASGPSPPDKPRRGTPPEEQARRRSLSDYPEPPLSADSPYESWGPDYLDPYLKRPTNARRHSHPENHSSDSSDDEPVTFNPRAKRRPHPNSPPPPSIRRFVPPSAPPPPSAASNPPPSFRPHRSEMRAEEQKRRNVHSPVGSWRNKLQETVSSMLPGGAGSERPRNGSRQNSYNGAVRSRRSREQFPPPTRLTRSYSDLDSDDTSEPGASDDEFRRRRRAREERDRDRARERGRADRERDDGRDAGPGRRDKQYLRRPEVQRRTSSHADIDRRREHPPWDPRDLRDREAMRADRKKWERRDERDLSPVTGVSGRRYPEAAYS